MATESPPLILASFILLSTVWVIILIVTTLQCVRAESGHQRKETRDEIKITRAMAEKKDLQQRYEACMVLSGAADALGYNGGRWEFENSGTKIHAEVADKGGLKKLDVGDFRVSDDTVMHLATAEALVESQDGQSLSDMYQKLAREYVKCMGDMSGRAPGMTCVESVNILKANKSGWKIPFNQRGGGCGAAMRAMCIGLRFPRPEAEKVLVAVSVESGRMTHHHPTGYLGALASALFTAYAVQGKALTQWGHGLLETLKKAKEYVRMSCHFVEENLNNWDYFETQWRDYLTERGILNGEPQAWFPERYGVEERDEFYVSLSFSGWGGSSGHDAPMIAYDGLLWAGASWEKLAEHSFFHGGDSDSTAAIAAAWWGAIYGYADVPAVNYERLEYRSRLVNLANELYELKDTPICHQMEPEEAASAASRPIPSLCEVRK